jgi:chaperonin cofactor prefoldin
MTNNMTDSSTENSTNSEETISLEEYNKLKTNFQELVGERDKVKSKLRELEKNSNSSVTELQTKYDELFATHNQILTEHENYKLELGLIKEAEKNRFIESTLITALESAGARSIPTAIKLIDKSSLEWEGEEIKSDSVINQIKALKVSDPILFGDTDPKSLETKQQDPGDISSNIPPVKTAGKGNVDGAYEKELRACKNQKEIEAVLKKYSLTK